MKKFIMAVLLTSMCTQTVPAYGMAGRVARAINYCEIVTINIIQLVCATYLTLRFVNFVDQTVYDLAQWSLAKANCTCFPSQDIQPTIVGALPQRFVEQLIEAGYACVCQ